VNVTLTAELGAGLDLWGPPTAGQVNVNWYVISFTIPFGDQDQDKPSTKPLDWTEFETRMLPPPGGATQPPMLAAARFAAPLAAAAPSEPANQVVLGIAVNNGLLSQEGEFGPTVQSAPFAIGVQSVMPASAITVSASSFTASSPPLGITPMNLPEIGTPLVLTLESESDTGIWTPLGIDRAGITAVATSAPAVAAVWSPVAFDPNGRPTANLIAGAVFGVTISTTADEIVDPLTAMDLLKAFGYEQAPPLNLPYSATPVYPVPAPLPQTGRFAALMGSVMAPGPVSARQTIMQALEDRMVAVLVDQDLSIMAKFADQIFQAAPSLAHMGFDLATTPQTAVVSAVRRAPTPAHPPAAVEAPHLLGMTQSYMMPTAAPRVAAAAIATSGLAHSIHLLSPKVVARWSDTERYPTAGSTPAARVSNQATFAAGGPAATGMTIRPGLLAVLSAGRGPGTPSLDLTGTTPVRVYAFDDAGRILSDTVRVPEGPGPAGALPADTQQVALVGLDDSSTAAPPVAGWSGHTTLFQVGHHTLLGSGCTVRPQASPRARRGMRELRRGPMEASIMLRNNRVQKSHDQTGPGWVETVFSHVVKTVAVVLGRNAASAAHVQISGTDSPWTVRYAGPVEPIRRVDATDGTILLFDATASTGARTAVLVRGIEGLSGVYGFPDAPDTVAQTWAGHSLPAFGRFAVRPAGHLLAAAVPAATTTSARLYRRQPSNA
jgi:hypothetical protein